MDSYLQNSLQKVVEENQRKSVFKKVELKQNEYATKHEEGEIVLPVSASALGVKLGRIMISEGGLWRLPTKAYMDGITDMSSKMYGVVKDLFVSNNALYANVLVTQREALITCKDTLLGGIAGGNPASIGTVLGVNDDGLLSVINSTMSSKLKYIVTEVPTPANQYQGALVAKPAVVSGSSGVTPYNGEFLVIKFERTENSVKTFEYWVINGLHKDIILQYWELKDYDKIKLIPAGSVFLGFSTVEIMCEKVTVPEDKSDSVQLSFKWDKSKENANNIWATLPYTGTFITKANGVATAPEAQEIRIQLASLTEYNVVTSLPGVTPVVYTKAYTLAQTWTQNSIYLNGSFFI
jgi:hypothetical protein